MSDAIGAIGAGASPAAAPTASSDDAALAQAFSQAALAAALSMNQSFIGDAIDAIQDTSADPDGES